MSIALSAAAGGGVGFVDFAKLRLKTTDLARLGTAAC
jgi:hypothetical protein